MLLDDQTAKRGITPHRGRQWIGAKEAQEILGISRAACLKLVQAGKLAATLDNKPGQRRQYRFRPADVRQLKEAGGYLKNAARPPRIRAAWVRLFGPIPKGFTVISRDGSHDNTSAGNLALIPQRAARRRRRRKAGPPKPWTLEMCAVLIRDYATRTNEDLAQELGVSKIAVNAKAAGMGLRKSREFMSRMCGSGRTQPIGTERVLTHDKNKGIILVKVSNTGTQAQRWRPKQNIIWEKHHRKRIPPNHRIVFIDGDRSNFDPSNLQLMDRDELLVRHAARFICQPSPLRKVVRLNKSLQREIRRQRDESPEAPAAAPKALGERGPRHLWTQEMVAVLERDYPTKPFEAVAKALGVTVTAVRAKASALGIKRLHETIIADAIARKKRPHVRRA